MHKFWLMGGRSRRYDQAAADDVRCEWRVDLVSDDGAFSGRRIVMTAFQSPHRSGPEPQILLDIWSWKGVNTDGSLLGADKQLAVSIAQHEGDGVNGYGRPSAAVISRVVSGLFDGLSPAMSDAITDAMITELYAANWLPLDVVLDTPIPER